MDDIYFHPTLYWVCDYLSILGLKLIHVTAAPANISDVAVLLRVNLWWRWWTDNEDKHYNDVMMGAMGSQITSLTIFYWTVYSRGYKRKHQSSASLAFVRGIHWWHVNSPHKRPATRKMFPFDDVISFSDVYFIVVAVRWKWPYYFIFLKVAVPTFALQVPKICSGGPKW